MNDQDRARWLKWVADFESSEFTQREFASERGGSLLGMTIVATGVRGHHFHRDHRCP